MHDADGDENLMNALKIPLAKLKALEASAFEAINAAEDEISIQTVKAAEAQEEIAKCISEIGTLHGVHGSSNW